ncbi:hypothetical protein [Posidoniimonas polymericola]|nr:hypothetical protein [Posidoniimonas polymericola]
MSTHQKIARNRVGLREQANPQGSVSRACRILGCSRDSGLRLAARMPQDD